jgi:hypothetical protein
MQQVTIFQAIIFFMVIAAVMYTTITLTNATANADSAADFRAKVGIISGVNAVLIIALTILGFLYVRADPIQERPYLLIMLHLNMFISLMAVSIAALQKIS